MDLKEDCTCKHGLTVGRCYALHMGPLVLQSRQNSLIKTGMKNLYPKLGQTTILHA
jgi:hypothetical protein